MDSLSDAIALSLCWTRHLGRRPRRARRPAPAVDPPERDAGSGGDRPDVSPWADVRSAATLEERLSALGVDDPAAEAAAVRATAGDVLERARARSIQAVVFGAPEFPVALAAIPDPPPVLWVRGDLRPDDEAVAIVGSRAATPHALEVAFQLGAGLARLGLVVVSGLARGVDGAAHRGALAVGGRTVAVLGSGVDVVYPPEHARLAGDIAASGAVASELVPGTPPLGWHFPRRNRIISGLSAGVVIVEASARSGSLITADQALLQGRHVMAVPGGVLSGRNRGAHGLIKAGACMVENADDVIEELHYVGAPGVMAADQARSGPSRPAPADPILRIMKAGESCDLAFLCEQTGIDAVRLLGRLSELELGGWIRRAGGGRFVRVPSNVLS